MSRIKLTRNRQQLGQASEVCGMTLQIPPRRSMVGGVQQLPDRDEGVCVQHGPNSNLLSFIANTL